MLDHPHDRSMTVDTNNDKRHVLTAFEIYPLGVQREEFGLKNDSQKIWRHFQLFFD